MGMGIQGAIAESQIEVNKASAEKMKVEAIKIAGVDTEKTGVEIQSLSQGIKNQKAQEKLTDMQTNLIGVEYDIKNATINDQIGIVRNTLQKGLNLRQYRLKQKGLPYK